MKVISAPRLALRRRAQLAPSAIGRRPLSSSSRRAGSAPLRIFCSAQSAEPPAGETPETRREGAQVNGPAFELSCDEALAAHWAALKNNDDPHEDAGLEARAESFWFKFKQSRQF